MSDKFYISPHAKLHVAMLEAFNHDLEVMLAYLQSMKASREASLLANALARRGYKPAL